MRWKIENAIFDRTPRRIICDSEVTRLNSRQAKLLVYLIENHDLPYTDKELIRVVGEGQIADETITSYISVLRKALGDEQKEYIGTDPYRLMVKPQRISDESVTAKKTSFRGHEPSDSDRQTDSHSHLRADEGISADDIRPTTPSPPYEISGARLDPFASVPPLPSNFIQRLEYAQPLRDALLSSSSPLAVTAIEGMGGVGKTVLVLDLCHDPHIRLAFPDGIIWLVIGKEKQGSLKDRIQRVAKALNQEFHEYTEDAYRTALMNKAALVVLDDVWNIADVEPFLIGSGRSRLLYTTRDNGLAGSLGAQSHTVGILEPAEARRFLSRWSGREIEMPPEPEASGILDACNGLALALAMIGAALKGKPNERWKFVLDDLKEAQLRKIAKKLTGYKYQNLHASIEVSVNVLEPHTRRCYLKLAVLLEDMSASAEFLHSLWGGKERDVDDLICLLVDLSLASRATNGGIRLHDLQLDFVRGEFPDQVALQLLHRALASCLHIVSPDGAQFPSQMIARLLVHQTIPQIAEFLESMETYAPRPRVWPLRTTLQSSAVFGYARTSLTSKQIETERIRLRELKGISDDSPRGFGRLRVLTFTTDKRHVISGSEDNTLCLWDIELPQPPQVLAVLPFGSNFAVALTPDGDRALFGSREQQLCIWDRHLRTPRNRKRDAPYHPIPASGSLRSLKSHSGIALAVALGARGEVAISASDDNSLRVWDLRHDEPSSYLIQQPSQVTAVALTDDGTHAVSGSEDGVLILRELESQRSIHAWAGHSSRINAVALTLDGRTVISGDNSGNLCLLSWEDKEPSVITWTGHSSAVNAVALMPAGRRAVSVSSDATIRVWDTSTSHCLATFTCDMPVWSCLFSNTHIIAGDAHGLVHVFSWQE